MEEGGGGMKVVVGVSDSLTGWSALRQAVHEARQRGADLHAVRAYPIRAAGRNPAPPLLARDGAAEAESIVRQAFANAMGGVPHDIDVKIVVAPGPARWVLADYTGCDDDLLVVGSGRRGVLGQRTARYCLAHAGCLVLVVPPQELARTGSTRALTRALNRDVDRLAGAELSR
jgi:nucleotide-binding universal stress UspA family protein